MNTEKVLKKLAAEPPVKVGNGGRAFKSLTAAVKAAEREKKEAVEAMVLTKQFMLRCSEYQAQMDVRLGRHERFMRWCVGVCVAALVGHAVLVFLT